MPSASPPAARHSAKSPWPSNPARRHGSCSTRSIGTRSAAAELRGGLLLLEAGFEGREFVLEAPEDGVDRLGDGPPLRLRGPKGALDAPAVEATPRALVLPAGLLGAWRLKAGQRVTIQAGAVAFGDVVVEEGQPAHVRLDPPDGLAAGLAEGAAVRWNPTLDLASPEPASKPDPKVRPTGRLITENDVRQARLRNQTIVVQSGQILTPAARSLGRELGVLREA